MKIKLALQHVAKDRPLVVYWVVFLLISLIIGIIFAFQIHPSELNPNVRYTVFGIRHLYNEPWYYLSIFIVFNLIILVTHSLIAMKLHMLGKVVLARLFILLSIGLVLIEYFLVSAVLGVAALPQ